MKFSEVLIQKPENKKDIRPKEIKVWIIEAKENSTIDPICWRLLTTHAITSYDQAVQIVE